MIDFTRYKLTLPVTVDGEDRGKAAEIRDLADSKGWAFEADGGTVFLCPDGGATTATAKYARCELRDLINFGSEDTVTDKHKFSVLSCPIGEKIVAHQIHGADDPWVKIVWFRRSKDFARLYALVKPVNGGGDETLLLLDDVPVSKAIVSTIKHDKGKLTIKATANLRSKTVKSVLQRQGENGAYFKRGNYPQNAERQGRIFAVWVGL